MKRGPKPMSAEEQARRGNPGKRKPKTDTPSQQSQPATASKAKLEKPTFLKGAVTKRIWEKLTGELMSMNFIRSTDTMALARYCQYTADWIKVNKDLSSMDSAVYETDTKHGKMLRIHPASVIRSRLEDDLVKLESVLGLTPMDRHRLMRDIAAQPQMPPGGMFNEEPTAEPAEPAASDPGIPTIGALH